MPRFQVIVYRRLLANTSPITLHFVLGIQPAVDDMNRAYGEFSNAGISRADFYAKCGQVAAEMGRQNAGKLSSHTTQ